VAAVVAPQPTPAPTPVAAPAPAAPQPGPTAAAATAAATPKPGTPAGAAADDDDEEDVIPIKQGEPTPSAAVMRNYPKGNVRVRFEVQPNGTTANVQVLSSTQRQLNPSAINAVKEWTFKPVKKTQTIEVEFAMNFE
jgi:TonB family protein